MGDGIFKIVWIVPVFVMSAGHVVKELSKDVFGWVKNRMKK